MGERGGKWEGEWGGLRNKDFLFVCLFVCLLLLFVVCCCLYLGEEESGNNVENRREEEGRD